VDQSFGRLSVEGSEARVAFVRWLPHPPAAVWRSLTEPDGLAPWFPTTVEGDRRSGAALRFDFPGPEAPAFAGTLQTFEPTSRLVLEWGEDTLVFALSAEAAGTTLELDVTFGVLGKAARDAAGWHACLDLLACALDGRDPPWSSAERWRFVHGTYVEAYGPEASAIGPPEEWVAVHGEP
jgi:uncharacterized protein YndB with AHSA1/START domain